MNYRGIVLMGLAWTTVAVSLPAGARLAQYYKNCREMEKCSGSNSLISSPAEAACINPVMLRGQSNK